MAWKRYLQREENYSPSTVNASLAALNSLFNFLGWTDCRTHYLKIQRRLFRETGRELDRADYEKLIAAALSLGRERIALVMETICATGIPVFALAATRTGITGRKTGAARNTRPFQTITDFPLTAAASVSREHTPCVQSASVTIPASNPQVRNGCGCVTAQARQTSTHWPISPL